MCYLNTTTYDNANRDVTMTEISTIPQNTWKQPVLQMSPRKLKMANIVAPIPNTVYTNDITSVIHVVSK